MSVVASPINTLHSEEGYGVQFSKLAGTLDVEGNDNGY